MIKLLIKEYKLTVMPIVYAFFSFVAMLFIPAYPYTIIFFYTTLAIFFSFLSSRENKDLIYMITLPLPKENIVKSRYAMVITIEILQIMISIPVGIIRSTLVTYQNVAGIEANIAFIGFVFIQFAVFNTVFLGVYFKNTSSVGKAFILGAIAETVIILSIEASVHVTRSITGSCFWDETTPEALLAQIPILFIGVILFGLLAYISYHRDVKNFMRQDI